MNENFRNAHAGYNKFAQFHSVFWNLVDKGISDMILTRPGGKHLQKETAASEIKLDNFTRVPA